MKIHLSWQSEKRHVEPDIEFYMRTVEIKTCDNPQDAALIKGRLENEGIPCFLINENFSALMPQFNGMMGCGIQIIIDRSDYEKAAAILKINKNAEKEQMRCPFCNSTKIRFAPGKRKILAVLLSLLAWIPFGNIKKTCYCTECKSEFKNY